MKNPFLAEVERRVLLADGAMGTILHERGIPPSACLDAVGLDQPDLVRKLHEEYIAAGADIIETNTFGGNRMRLGRYGLQDRVHEINFRAARLARDAREISGHPVFVAGAVGPVGRRLVAVAAEPTSADLRAAFQEQVEALLEGGVDLIVLETFPDLIELGEALLAVRASCDLPVIAELNFQRDGRTLAGEPPDECANVLQSLGADAAGVNCSLGPQAALDVIEQMAAASSIRLSAMPNAGLPRLVGGRMYYPSTPEYFAEYARRLAMAGANIVGGCCGTTPAHITAMRQALSGEWALAASPPPAISATADSSPEAPEVATPASLRQKLGEGRFVVSVEIDPPRGLNPRKALEGAAALRQAGADCINIGDSPMARVRMSAIALAVLIQQRVGLETIIHFTTRDRNLMAIQSDLLGAHALGIRNVIALTGDPPTTGEYQRASGVWDVDSIGLIRILKMLNQGTDWAGNSIGRPTEFFVAAAANPTAEDLPLEIDRVRQKLDAGADLLMTQPVYSAEVLREFVEKLGPLPVPLLAGVMPLQSYRHAEFIHNELAGVVVPESVRDRMRLAGENGVAEGLALSRELLSEIRGLCSGVYLMPSFGRYEVVAELVVAAHQAGGLS